MPNIQWLSQQINTQLAANSSATASEMATAISALRAPNTPIPVSVLAPLLMQTQTWANILGLLASPPSGTPVSLLVAAQSAVHLVTGNVGTVDLSLPTVQAAMSALSTANILTSADQLTLTNMATPLLCASAGWSNGVTANDVTNAQQYNAIAGAISQMSNNWNTAIGLLQNAQSSLSSTPAGTLSSVTTPTVSTVSTALTTGLSW
jgi:hypothetical protein